MLTIWFGRQWQWELAQEEDLSHRGAASNGQTQALQVTIVEENEDKLYYRWKYQDWTSYYIV